MGEVFLTEQNGSYEKLQKLRLTSSSRETPWGFPGGPVVKNLPANAEDMGFDPWSGKLPPPQLLSPGFRVPDLQLPKPRVGPAPCKRSRLGGQPSPRGQRDPAPGHRESRVQQGGPSAARRK